MSSAIFGTITTPIKLVASSYAASPGIYPSRLTVYGAIEIADDTNGLGAITNLGGATGAVSLYNQGIIEGPLNSTAATGMDGVYLTVQVDVFNIGTIRGGVGVDRGGVGVSLASGIVTNEYPGDIEGGYASITGGIGVDLSGSASLLNDQSLIHGGGSKETGGIGVYDHGGYFNNDSANGGIYGGRGVSGGGGIGVAIIGSNGLSTRTGVILNQNYGFIQGGAGPLDSGKVGAGVYLRDSKFTNHDQVVGGGQYNDVTKEFTSSADAVYLKGNSTFDNFGTVLAHNAASNTAVEFEHDSNATFIVEQGSVIAGHIVGFNRNDTIDLVKYGPPPEGSYPSNWHPATHTLDIGGRSLLFSGSYVGERFSFTSDGKGGTDVTLVPACFARGTRVHTARGEIAIETLRIGDRIVTASGNERPVRWLGHRRIECSAHVDPASVWPVCIRAGAIAENSPCRDLWVSPDHSIFIQGVLIQAHRLLNGVTIVQEPRARIDYWHVELDTHDLLLAEGLASETYLDTGNRCAFSNGGAFLEAFPDFKPKHWAETCVPLVFEGEAVQKARTSLLDRAVALGFTLTHDPDLHAMIDGIRIDPLSLGAERLAFLLPEGGSSIELHSRTFVPAHIYPNNIDCRSLGIDVLCLQIDGEVAHDDEGLWSRGWHQLERCENGRHHRWSSERMPLPAGTRLVVIDMRAQKPVYWLAPAALAKSNRRPSLARLSG